MDQMVYTSYSRCVDRIKYVDEHNEQEEILELKEIPHKLVDLSKGAFKLEWKDVFCSGIHFEFEQLDADYKYKNMLKILRQNTTQHDFLMFHMAHTIYDWNFDKCSNCEKQAKTTCTACYKERYCGASCQRQRWTHHKCECVNQF